MNRVFALCAILAGSLVHAAGTTYLVLDDRVVDKVDGLRLETGTVQKSPANPLFREDRPWEVRFDNLYPNIAYDEGTGTYRCWYSPFIVDEVTATTPAARRRTERYYASPTREMGLCLAESADGIHWNKPNLGVVAFEGRTDNNLVARSVHGAGVMRDDDERDPARRYKLFGGEQIPGHPRRFQVRFSPDGVHWSPSVICPEVGVEGDTHNNAIWVPALGRYVGITRRWLAGQRLVMRTESRDFTRWTAAVEVLRGDDKAQTYAMTIFPYQGVYLGLLMTLNIASNRVQCELAWSPDTLLWRRIDAGDALIRDGAAGTYDFGCVFAAAKPVIRQDDILLYYGASDDTHDSWRHGSLALATLKRDRFAGYVAGATDGVLVTRPVRVTGDLSVNLAAERGACTVDVLDQNGARLDGYSGLAAASVSAKDELAWQPQWRDGKSLAALKGRDIRLQFHLRSATLYSFSLSTDSASPGSR